MTRARILADYVSSGDELALKAPLASPTFTGTVAIPNVANLETAVVANTAKTSGSTSASDLAIGTLAVARMADGTIIKNTVIDITGSDFLIWEHVRTAFAMAEITCTVGNTLFISISCQVEHVNSGSIVDRYGTAKLYIHTVTAAQNVTPVGTLLASVKSGRTLIAASSASCPSFSPVTVRGKFVATATTHFVGLAGVSPSSSNGMYIRISELSPQIIVQEVQGDIT